MVRIDMDMPENCEKCPFYGYVSDTFGAYCKGFYRDAQIENADASRQKWCPLIQIDKQRDGKEEYVKLNDILEFPIRRHHYDKKNGNIYFIDGIETVIEYINNLPRYV